MWNKREPAWRLPVMNTFRNQAQQVQAVALTKHFWSSFAWGSLEKVEQSWCWPQPVSQVHFLVNLWLSFDLCGGPHLVVLWLTGSSLELAPQESEGKGSYSMKQVILSLADAFLLYGVWLLFLCRWRACRFWWVWILETTGEISQLSFVSGSMERVLPDGFGSV